MGAPQIDQVLQTLTILELADLAIIALLYHVVPVIVFVQGLEVLVPQSVDIAVLVLLKGEFDLDQLACRVILLICGDNESLITLKLVVHNLKTAGMKMEGNNSRLLEVVE